MKELFITNEHQKQWVDTLEKERDAFQANRQYNDEHSSFPKSNVETLVRLGYTKLPLTEEYGGTGFTVTDLVLFQETIGSMDSATALAIGWHQGVVAEIFAEKLWSDEMLEELAEALKNGALINRAQSEAKTGSPTRGGIPGTVAKRTENGWIIDGRKSFTTMSPVLTHFLISAWVEETETISTFLIPREAKGVSIEENWNMLGMRATESHDLLMQSVEVPERYLVEERPFERSRKVANNWNLHIPACYLGIAQAARDEAVHFSLVHQPNSIQTAICELPNVQQHIGEIDIELSQIRHTLYSIARLSEDPEKLPQMQQQLAIAKYTVTNGAIRIVDRAMRLVGAKSLQMENPLQQHYRDVRAGLHNPPMDDMTIINVAKEAIARMKRSSDLVD